MTKHKVIGIGVTMMCFSSRSVWLAPLALCEGGRHLLVICKTNIAVWSVRMLDKSVALSQRGVDREGVRVENQKPKTTLCSCQSFFIVVAFKAELWSCVRESV